EAQQLRGQVKLSGGMQSGTKTAESKCENSAGSSAAEMGSARFEVGNEDGKNRARQTALQFQFGKTEPDESPIWNGVRLRAAGEFKRESKAWLKQIPVPLHRSAEMFSRFSNRRQHFYADQSGLPQ